MNQDTLFFFDGRMDALPLYEAFEQRVFAEVPQATVKVQKTQISFVNRHMFACVSFARVRRRAECPNPYIVVTFGLAHRVEAPRIEVATEPYPGRWTHHVVVGRAEEIDGELMEWIREAAAFSASKR